MCTLSVFVKTLYNVTIYCITLPLYKAYPVSSVARSNL